MTFAMWGALIVVIGTVWALIKRYETRLVLLTSGLLMTLLSRSIRWPPSSSSTSR